MGLERPETGLTFAATAELLLLRPPLHRPLADEAPVSVELGVTTASAEC
jgi:hypothetical protein